MINLFKVEFSEQKEAQKNLEWFSKTNNNFKLFKCVILQGELVEYFSNYLDTF